MIENPRVGGSIPPLATIPDWVHYESRKKIDSQFSGTERYRPNKRPFPKSHQVWPGHQTRVDLRFDAVLAQMTPRASRNSALQRALSTVSTRNTTATLPPSPCRSRWPYSCACLPIRRTGSPAVARGHGRALHDPVAALFFCHVPQVRHVVVNGRVVVRDGQLTTLD